MIYPLFYHIFWFIVGLGIGAIIILELVQGVVDPETWNKINYTEAMPNEFKKRVNQILSSFNGGSGTQ